jgi:hypothetical protein
MLTPALLIPAIIADTFVLCSINLGFSERVNFAANFIANCTLRTSMLINEFYSLNHMFVVALILSLMNVAKKYLAPVDIFISKLVYIFHTIYI